VTGVTEIVGGVAILIPGTTLFGGLLFAITMSVAVPVHLFVTGGSPVPAIVLLLITATVAWLHRPGVTLGR